MDTSKRERLEAAGFRVSTVADFLGLTPEESEAVENKVALTDSATVGERFIAPSSPAAPQERREE